MNSSSSICNALSFDVEEYFHVHAFRDVIRPDDWPSLPSRVVSSTRTILHSLAAHDTRATFFVLGWVAEKHPALVREIADGGHEVASHGFAHGAVDGMDRGAFRRDIERAGEAILSACPGVQIRGYRAPSFSINASTPWAFEELRAVGIDYDSSVSPASLHDRYGVRGAPRFAHYIADGLVEAPPTTVRLMKNNFPAAGGGHFRLAPLAVTKWAIRRVNREGHPAVTYLHPWEFDPGQPRVRKAPWKSRLRHYLNIHRTQARLDVLIREFRFGRMDEVFADMLEGGPETMINFPRGAGAKWLPEHVRSGDPRHEAAAK